MACGTEVLEVELVDRNDTGTLAKNQRDLSRGA
jgi:hypothetical protein